LQTPKSKNSPTQSDVYLIATLEQLDKGSHGTRQAQVTGTYWHELLLIKSTGFNAY